MVRTSRSRYRGLTDLVGSESLTLSFNILGGIHANNNNNNVDYNISLIYTNDVLQGDSCRQYITGHLEL